MRSDGGLQQRTRHAGKANRARRGLLRSGGASADGSRCAGPASRPDRVDADTQRRQRAHRRLAAGPGPLMRTSRFLMPCSCAARPAVSAATCAANGVDLREPLKPWPPDDAQDSALPWRSVIVMMVLLNDACTCAMPSATFLRTFLLHAARCGVAGALAIVMCLQCSGDGITSSARRRPCAGPCGCGHWCACAGRAPAGRGGGACRGSSPGPSAA